MFHEKADLSGVASTRTMRVRKQFEAIVDSKLGDTVRADGAKAVELWCALTGTIWIGLDGGRVQYTGRTAAAAVGWVREEQDDVIWYASGDPGMVAPWIESALSGAGWCWERSAASPDQIQ